MRKSLHPTRTTLLGHNGGYIQLEAAQHHPRAEELPVHGLSAEKVQGGQTNLTFWTGQVVTQNKRKTKANISETRIEHKTPNLYPVSQILFQCPT